MTEKRKNKTAKLNMIFSCAAFGTIGLFVKAIPLPSGETALYRAVIALVVLFFVLLLTGRLKREKLSLLKGQLVYLLLSGAAMGFNWILLFEAYNYTSIALSTLCYYFAPVIVTVASVFLFREKPLPRQWICSAASVAGLVLIIGVSGGGSGSDLKGVLLALGSAVLYSTVILLNKHIRGIDGVTRSFLQFGAAALFPAPHCALSGGFHLSALQGAGLWAMLLVGVFHSGVLYCMYFSALSILPGQESAILSYIDPFIAVVLSALVLGETITPLQLIGGAVILLSTLINEISPARKRRKTE